MRKWYVPLTVLGLGGLGLWFLTERGRASIHWLFENAQRAPETFLGWNETAQRELDRIQAALNQVAEQLETAR